MKPCSCSDASIKSSVNLKSIDYRLWFNPSTSGPGRLFTNDNVWYQLNRQFWPMSLTPGLDWNQWKTTYRSWIQFLTGDAFVIIQSQNQHANQNLRVIAIVRTNASVSAVILAFGDFFLFSVISALCCPPAHHLLATLDDRLKMTSGLMNERYLEYVLPFNVRPTLGSI